MLTACGLGLAALGLPRAAAWAAGVVALMATWWITEPLPLWATALLPLPLFPLLGGGKPDELLHQLLLQYFDPVNFLFLGGMWLAAAMEQSGLHERLALGMVARIGYSPRRIVLGFMVATGFVTLWISNTAAALMMFPIAMAVLRRFEAQRGRDDPQLRRFGLALMLGLAYAASIGGIGTKIGTGTNMVFVRQAERSLGLEVSFVQWIALGLPVVLVALPLVWLYLVRVATGLSAEDFPGARETITAARGRLGVMKTGELVALVMFLLAAGLWIFRQDIELGAVTVPGWARLMPEAWRSGDFAMNFPPPLAGLLEPRAGESLVAIVLGAALLLIPVARRPLRMALSLRQAAGVQWGMLILLGGGFAMARGVEASGLSAVIGDALAGVPRLPPLLVTLGVALVAVALTEFASNTATASILLPLLAPAAPALGVPAPTLMLAATMAASFGFMLPAGTPPNAVVYASGYIPVTRMARCGLVVDVAGALLVGTLCHLLVPRILVTAGAP
ncbi:MAG: SLC13 family permease [Limisphaerales bacterium]